MDRDRVRAIVITASILAAGSGCTLSWKGHPPPGTSPATVAVTTPSPSAPASAGGLGPPSTSAPPPDLAAEVRAVEDQVTQLRGLRLPREIPLQRLAPERFQSEGVQACLAERTDVTLTPETLMMLGLVPGQIDLDSTDATLAADWVARITSRYDGPSGKIELVDQPSLDPAWRLDYVVAYLSALRAEGLNGVHAVTCCPIACVSTDDPGLAFAALSVGDARLIQEQWVRTYGSQADAARLGSLLDPAEEASLFRSPQFVNDDYDFVLRAGRAFVQQLYLAAGWSSVDRAYADPPTSTEQILHPERYPEDDPLPLPVPDLSDALGSAWEQRQTIVLGEWRMRQMLQSFLSPDEAAKAASNWGGDILVAYHNALLDKDLFVLIARWDNLRQAQDFALAFRKYGEARFGERRPTASGDTWTWDGGYSLLERASDQTLWIMAPDRATAETVRAYLEFPVQVR